MGQAPLFVDRIRNGTPQTFANADGTSAKTIWTVPASGVAGEHVSHIMVAGNNDAALTVFLDVVIGGTAYPYSWATLATSSGAGAIRTVNLLDPTYAQGLDADRPALDLQPGASLQVRLSAAVASGRSVSVVPTGGTYTEGA